MFGGSAINIDEILKWEHKLQNLENFVALQIIKNILTEIPDKDKTKNQLVTLMKIYSIRAVFESCACIGYFDLKQIKDKCQHVLEKNVKLFEKSF